MRIAIFDTDLSSAEHLKRLLYIFSNFKKYDFVVDVFTNKGELVKSKENYKLYFISFKTRNGIAISEYLYNHHPKTPIIITSPYTESALYAFRINAYNFLKTPIQKESLFKILENLFATSLFPLFISDGFETVCLYTDDIFYLEANNKHCLIHLKNQTIQCNKTMARVFEILPENNFLKISRAFIVNSNYISRFNSENITLINGDTLHPSRHFYKSFKYTFLQIQSPKIL